MKKLLSTAMSFALVFAFTPVTAFAEVAPADPSVRNAEAEATANTTDESISSDGISGGEISSDGVSNVGSSGAVSSESANQQGSEENTGVITTAETSGDFDKVDDTGTYYDESTRFRYYWEITSVADAEGALNTAKIYTMDFKYEDDGADENGNGVTGELLVPASGDGSIDWTIPATVTSEHGVSYTVTAFTADLQRTQTDYTGTEDENGSYPMYCPIQFMKSITVPKDVETITSFGEPAAVTLGHSGALNHVKTITFQADSKVKALPDGFAHQMLYLNSVTLPAGLETIGLGAFWECFSLSSISLPSGIKEIGKLAFADTNLGSVTLPDGLETIGDGAFSWGDYTTGFPYDDAYLKKSNYLTKVAIPNTVTTIGSCAFSQASPNASYSQGLGDSMNYSAWWSGNVDATNDTRLGLSSISEITLGSSVKAIGSGAFAGCIASEITIPASVETIGEGAFAASSLAKASWVDEENSKLTSLNGFGQCAWLKSFDIPMSVNTIGENAFWNCTALANIFIPASVTAIDSNAFASSGLESLHIASGSNALIIGSNAFYGCSGLAGATIELPERVSALGTGAFQNIPNATYKIYNDKLELWEEECPVLGGIPGIEVPVGYVSDADKAKWDNNQWEGQTDTIYMFFSDPWYDGGELGYDTSNNFNWVPKIDIRNATVYYPSTLTYDTSLSLKAYVDQAVADRAAYEDPNTDHYRMGFNKPRFVAFDASAPQNADDTVDVRGGAGIIEVTTTGSAGSSARICVMDIAGDLVASGQANAGYALIEGIDDGTYTVIAFANNSRFATIGSETDLAAMGVDSSHYAKATNVKVTDGSAEVSLEVPSLSELTLNSAVKSSTLNIGKTDVMMGTEVYADISFTLNDSYNAQEVTVKVPAGLEVTSVYSRNWDYLGNGARFNTSSRVLKVDISNGKTLGSNGVHRLWVGLKPALPGYYSINASVKAGGITVPTGSASFDCRAVSLEVPADPVEDTSGATFPVTVHAAPGSYVDVSVGDTTMKLGPTNKNGTFTKEVDARSILRDSNQPASIVTTTRDFLVRASLEVGGVTYTDTGTVSFMRQNETNVKLWDFSFIHAGITYDIVKNGKRVANSKYYTYVADGRTKNEFWTFRATFKGNAPLGNAATVQVQMLDGSSRYSEMGLVNQIQIADALGGTYTASYATTIRIEQAGDHVFPHSLIPCGFDVSYGLKEEAEPISQTDVNIIKWKAIGEPLAVATSSQEKDVMRQLYTGIPEDKVNEVLDADSSIAMFSNFMGYMGTVLDGNGGVSSEDAVDYFAEAVWEIAQTDSDFREDLEAASNGGDGGETIDIVADPANNQAQKKAGVQKVKKILVGEPDPDTGKYTGGIVGDSDGFAEAMLDNYMTGMNTKPRDAGNMDNYLNQVKIDDALAWDEAYLKAYEYEIISDDDTLNQSLAELEEMLKNGIGTPGTGNNFESNPKSPNKIAIKVNRDSNDIPESYELVDINGNHVKFNVPGLLRDYMLAYDKKDVIADKLKGKLKDSFNEFAESKTGKKLAPVAKAYLDIVDKEIDIGDKMGQAAADAGKTLGNKAKEGIKDWWKSEMKLLADSQLAYDIVKKKLSSWAWKNMESAIDNARTKWKNAQAEYERTKDKVSSGLSQRCIEARLKLANLYEKYLKNIVEKSGDMLADYYCDAFWFCMSRAIGKNVEETQATVKKAAQNGARALWKYDIFGTMALSDKINNSISNQIKNAIQALEELCNPKKIATYQKSVILDPSGTVYEAVESNTLSGVTAKVYEVSDPDNPVPWNATEYDQVNPQATSEDGVYGWNVPTGNWKVDFSKEGYIATTTSALPVPPPQMGLTTPMFTTAAPQVVAVNASPSYIDIVFDQYMNINDTGVVIVNGDAEIGIWENELLGTIRDGVNGEVKDGYVSKVLRIRRSSTLGQTLTVKLGGFMSYAGLTTGLDESNMATHNVVVKNQPTSIEFVSGVGEASPLPVAVSDANDANAANSGAGTAVVRVLSGSAPLAGVTVTASLDNSDLATLGTITGTTNDNGEISIPLTGKLPGVSVLTVAVENTGVSNQADIFTTFTDETQVARPIVMVNDEVVIGAGTATEVWKTVAPGAKLAFSCATEGATIYFTTDGSCPCDNEGNRTPYTGPITVNQSIETLRVGAEKQYLADSERVKLHLTVSDGTVDKSALVDALNKASASPYTDAVKISTDGKDVLANEKWVTQEMADTLKNAKDAAATIAASDSASQAVVNEVLSNLNAAMNAYQPKAGTKSVEPLKIDISQATIDPILVREYTGSAITPDPVVRHNGKVLTKGTDYTVEYKNNINVGTATVTVKGKGLYSGSKNATFTIAAKSTPTPTPTPTPAPDPDPTPAVEDVPMQRLYNPNSGEHFYTANIGERDMLVGVGWNYEGVGWTAPSTSSTPVYRMYNANGGEHHYTMSEAEKDMLVGVGWNYEGIGWYSDDQQRVVLYRDYNPNAFANNHNYTTSVAEHEMLVGVGWNSEGYAWYGM